MSTSIPRDLLLLPNELERKQMFHLLKKHSSWTAWNRILSYYQKWADITEESVRQSDERGLFSKQVLAPNYTPPPGVTDEPDHTSILYQDYVDALKGLALFDKGVRRLAQGDKRVFTNDEATGLFERGDAAAHINYYMQSKWKLDDGEIIWKETTPLMKEFFEAIDEIREAWGECGRTIIEPEERYRDMQFWYGLWHMVFLPQLPYPNPLPDLPEIFDLVEVKTGEIVPYSGIWEPVEGSTHIGAMGYLHGGRLAPKPRQHYRDKSDLDYGYSSNTQDATWRLLWRDDRYEDGSIPEEERDYQFLNPPSPGKENLFDIDPWRYLEDRNLPNPLLDDIRPENMRCEGGNICPQDGNWWTPANREGHRSFKKGEIMPDYPASSYGSTIWYRVKE